MGRYGNVHGELGNGTQGLVDSIPDQVSGIADIIEIAAGGYHSLFLKNDRNTKLDRSSSKESVST